MRRFVANAARNFFIARCTSSRDVRPLVVTYHLTHRCNLRCFFCEHCGIEHNARWEREGELSTDEALRLLRMLSKPFAFLYLTGGEPFLRADAGRIFDEIARLPFRNVTVNTNLTMMEPVERCLDAIDNLVVSIDAVDPDRFDAIRGVKGMGRRVLANFERAIALQKPRRFRLHVNCVVTPQTIDDARGVLHHCVERGVRVGVNAQNDRHGPVRELLDNGAFRALVAEMMELKAKTRLVVGTKAYYERMFHFQPYACYPFLTPRINAKGELAYPCDNLGQWVPGVAEAENWEAVVERARAMYGPIPDCRKACQFQCYIEPSLMVRRPWVALREYL